MVRTRGFLRCDYIMTKEVPEILRGEVFSSSLCSSVTFRRDSVIGDDCRSARSTRFIRPARFLPPSRHPSSVFCPPFAVCRLQLPLPVRSCLPLWHLPSMLVPARLPCRPLPAVRKAVWWSGRAFCGAPALRCCPAQGSSVGPQLARAPPPLRPLFSRAFSASGISPASSSSSSSSPPSPLSTASSTMAYTIRKIAAPYTLEHRRVH